MNQQHYQTTIAATATPSEAFKAICNIPAWWTQNTIGDSKNEGGIFTVQFGDTYKTSRVSQLIPEKEIVWEVIDCLMPWLENRKEWKGTKVIWEIGAKSGQTEIVMTHIGVHTESECYDQCKKGWDFYITQSLQKLLTDGIGLPDGKAQCATQI